MEKKIILLICLFFSASFLYAQNLKTTYIFSVKNDIVDKIFDFPALLYLDKNGKKNYIVQFGIAEQINEKENQNDVYVLYDKSKFNYQLYSENHTTFYIKDGIKGKTYYLKDEVPPMKYDIKNETKILDGIQLKKATIDFRGRYYIIWFDDKTSVSEGPWKFNNLPGMAYEIYDDKGLFKWTLKKIENTHLNIENPFENLDSEQGFISYTEYPKLKYKGKVFMQTQGQKGAYVEMDLERDGLETKFEWEH